MKKLLSIILAVVMTVSALTLCVAAADEGAATSTVGYDASRVVKPDNLAEIRNILEIDDGFDTETAYKVNSPEGLLRVATAVKSDWITFEGVTIYLTKDLDMTGIDWVPIGFKYNEYFYGTFDGLGHIISNLTYDDSGSEGTVRYSSLFGGVRNATIRNVVVDNTCSFKYSGSNGENRTSGLVAYIHGSGGETTTIENCFSAATVNGKRFVGGILGQSDCTEVSITNTTFAGNVTTTGIAGGFGSYVYGRFTIKNCWNAGNITSTGSGTDQHNGAAGFISRALPKDTTDASQYSLENCINTGTIKGGAAAGILSSVALAKPMQIKNCTNYGNIVAGDGITGAKLDEIAVVFDGQTAPTMSGNESKSGQASGLTLPKFIPNYTADDGVVLGARLELVQKNLNTGNAIRLVGSIDSLNYQRVGFKVEVRDDSDNIVQRIDHNCKTVYESVLDTSDGVSVKYSASGANGLRDGGALYALIINGIPAGEYTFSVTPYSVKGGSTTYGTTTNVAVNIAE